MRDTCVADFCAFIAVPEQVVELRTMQLLWDVCKAVNTAHRVSQGSAALCPSTTPGCTCLIQAATWLLGFSHHGVLGKGFKTKKKGLGI